MNTIDAICEKIKPESPNWTWDWYDRSDSPAMVLRGTYKGDTKVIIRSVFSYVLLLNNIKKALELVNKSVANAEKEAIIMNTPLFKVLRE